MIQYPNIRITSKNRSTQSANHIQDSHPRYSERIIDEDCNTEYDIANEGNERSSSKFNKFYLYNMDKAFSSIERKRLRDRSGRITMCNPKIPIRPAYSRGPIDRSSCRDHYSPIKHLSLHDIMLLCYGSSFGARYYENSWARKEGYR